ncbi:hypothetical protein FRC18_005468 [Serendipita sp. 400]|nr:hypothetical protein FRC18_005468 [Serendipita sp. 400]
MENKKKGKNNSQKRVTATAKSINTQATILPTAGNKERNQADPSSPSRSADPSLSNTSSPSASKTSYVRASLALTSLQPLEHTDAVQNQYVEEDRDHLNEDQLQQSENADEVEPYSPNHPYYDYTGVEYVDSQFLEAWEYNLRLRLKQAYPRMCYFFLCDKRFFVLVTLLTLRRLAKAEGLSGRAMGKSKRDRQFVDKIAQCMSDAETRFDKDEEWVTWWKETLVMVQTGLKRGWILANNPSIAYAKDVMKLYQKFATIAKCLAEVEVEP